MASEKKPCGLDVPLIPKGTKPNEAQNQGWFRNDLVRGNDQVRMIQDFSKGPSGWPYAAPTTSAPKKDAQPMDASPTMPGRRKR